MPKYSLFDENTYNHFSTAFTIAGLNIQWYAIFILIGIFVAIIIGCYRAKFHYKLKYDFLYYYALILIPVSLFGARFWSACIGDLQWSQFFAFRTGGLAIQGGIVAVLIMSLIYFPLVLKNPKYHVRVEVGNQVFIQKPSLWIMFDICVPLILIGQAIGRWGNFFNGEIYGTEVSKSSMQWLQVIMPGVYDKMHAGRTIADAGVIEGHMYQPLFLYESLIDFVSFAIIYFVIPNIKQIKIGVIGSSYFIIYGVTRFATESLRSTGYKYEGTYVLNGLLLALGVICIIIAQFIAPRFRDKQIIYRIYCQYIRFNYIRLLKKFNLKSINKYLAVDKNLDKLGFKEKPTFTREEEQMLYYGPNE